MPSTRTYFGPGGVILPSANGASEKSSKGSYTWIDIASPGEEDFLWLGNTYAFHPLTIEDCRQFDQRAKVQEYDSYLFITMAVPRHGSLYDDMDADELHAYLGADYLVTVHTEPLEALDLVRQRLATDKGKLKTSPDFLFYLLADQLIAGYFKIIDDLEDEIGILEDEIVASPDRDTLNRIFKLKQQLVYMRKTASPERDLFHALSGQRFPLISHKTELYFRDTYDQVIRIYESIETSRDLLSNALDAYLSVVSNRLNDVMRRLTIIATIFMPLSFIVGFGGMNFTALPFDSPIAFAFLMALIVLTPLLMAIWFWRRSYV
jgi:magnesium transporter